MKGRTIRKLLDMHWNGFQRLGTNLAPDQLDGYLRSKLLSSRGCATLNYEEGDQATRKSLSPSECAFYKSLPEWSEEH